MTVTPSATAFGSAHDLLCGYAAGTLSPVEVTSEALDRIDRTNADTGAFVAVDREGALEAARTAESRWRTWRGEKPLGDDWQRLPTWGVPVSVKDTIEQKGLPTTYGSVPFADNHQPDALVVQRLRRAGCTLLGKTSTSEFALSTITATRLAPPARNPWNLERTAGGSSGGASAAAALGIGAFALATDSAGSIRLPAAYCGVYGLKPTLGTVPIRQAWRASPVRSHIGPIAATVADLLYAWRVLTEDRTPVMPLDDEQLRVGLVVGDPDHRTVIDEAVAILTATGRCVLARDAVTLPPLPGTTTRDGDWVFAGDHLAAAERLLPDFWKRHGHELSGYARGIYDAGRRVPAWEYRAALDGMERYRDRVQEVFDSVDILLTSTTEAPPALTETTDPDDLGPRYPLLSAWNYAGNPALVVPLAPDRDGTPRAVQLVGRPGADRLLLRLVRTLAQVAGDGIRAATQPVEV